MNPNLKARVIAFYLPQYHPTPENDKFWGKGFTEWTNVAKAVPLFHGHEQPRIPADLGFYDLRLPEIAAQQAELAKEAGIEGFCYWHYWFGGGQETLQMPLDRMVSAGSPDYPFCIGWANHDWTTKSWTKGKARQRPQTIFKQQYLGEDDHLRHFERLLPAFLDKRYITVDGKLLFVLFDIDAFVDFKAFKDCWNRLAKKHGLPGFHFVGLAHSLDPQTTTSLEKYAGEKFKRYFDAGYDGLYSINQKYAEMKAGGLFHKAVYSFFRRLLPGFLVEKYKYSDVMRNYYTPLDKKEHVYPQLLAGWDRSPRSGKNAIIYYEDTPEEFKKVSARVIELVKNKDPEHRIIFLNSWNEWGEGAYMEPDLRHGKGKIKALATVLRQR